MSDRVPIAPGGAVYHEPADGDPRTPQCRTDRGKEGEDWHTMPRDDAEAWRRPCKRCEIGRYRDGSDSEDDGATPWPTGAADD
jgi:hypothetical protein